jgi:hypothetical protein
MRGVNDKGDPGHYSRGFFLAKPYAFTNFYPLFTGYLLGKFTQFIHGKFWVKSSAAIVNQYISGGVCFGWVSFLLKQLAKGENNYGAMIVFRNRGRRDEKDTAADYMFNGHRMCCP